MAEQAPENIEHLRGMVAAAFHDHWKVFLAQGLVMMALGLVAVALPNVAHHGDDEGKDRRLDHTDEEVVRRHDRLKLLDELDKGNIEHSRRHDRAAQKTRDNR